MEYMRLVGWADSGWKLFHWKQVWKDEFHHTQGLANMVRNAFLASSMPLTTWPSWPHGVAMANMLAIRVCHLSAPALRRGLSKADLSQMRQAPATPLGALEGAWLNCSLTGRGLMRRLKPLSGLRAAAEPEASLRAKGRGGGCRLTECSGLILKPGAKRPANHNCHNCHECHNLFASLHWLFRS